MLIRTDASADTWTTLMDGLCREGDLNLITKLRWKASRFGGRPFALPSAPLQSLAATRRRRGRAARPAQATDFMAEVRLSGDPGTQDRAIMDALMAHLVQHTGLTLRAADSASQPKPGFWRHLASHEAGAPPGVVRVYLSSQHEVQRLYDALHGQLVAAGADWLSVAVLNDSIAANLLSGNGGRASK